MKKPPEMNMENFEEHLSRQPLRQIPGEWRAEILQTARAASRRATLDTRRVGWLSVLSDQLSTLLWPHPRAWAGLAAVWVAICALHFASRDITQRFAKESAPPSPELIAAVRAQEKLLVELLADRPMSRDAEQPGMVVPRPRSERHNVLLMG